ncbi:DExH-box splicing factor binding site-domain-containing protein [Cyathus striatus]|nr:DExH-box splicing factor binding site-domain-containing protein [Cyathus striatus]
MSDSKVSFTIRRPTPVSRVPSALPSNVPSPAPRFPSPAQSPHPHFQPHHPDSSDDDAESQDELVTSFDKFGVQRLNRKSKKLDGPLVIPALENRDWKEVARKRKAGARFVPPSASAQTGADGSVGGLGTKDAINAGPVRSGLQIKERHIKVEQEDVNGDVAMHLQEEEEVKVEETETEDQRALRALLAESSGGVPSGSTIDIIPAPVSEAEALKQDIEELPDVATLEDYERVPVSQFGAALLRGMGWKEGTAASRKPGKGMIEPYLPAARPALLGIGAKEMEVFDDGNNGKNKKFTNSRKPGKYMPIVRQEREGTSTPGSRSGRDRSRSPNRSDGIRSRRPSKSLDRKDRDKDIQTRGSRRDHDYDQRDRYRGSMGDRDRDRKYDDKDKHYPNGERDGKRDGDRRNRSRERRRDY